MEQVVQVPQAPILQLPGTQHFVIEASDFPGSKTYMTENCNGCCPYLPHRGFGGNKLECRTCGGTGHKPGCQARR
jgi:hypothetical protein